MNLEYSVVIYWSKEDQAFLSHALELPGAMADGKTKEEALQNLEVVIGEWIETAKEEGRKIPPPMDAAEHQRSFQEFRESVEQYVKREVETAVSRVLQDIARSQNELGIWGSSVFVGGTVQNDPSERWKIIGGR